MTNTKRRQSIGIETSGNSVDVNVEGRDILEVAIRGDGTAEYRVDGREDPSQNWVQGTMGDPEYSGAADYDDTLRTAWNQLRIVCVTGTASAGDQAEVVLCAGGK